MQDYTPAALQELVRLTTQAESEQARIMAIKELFDRAYGKSSQHVESEQQVTVDYNRAREELRDLVIKLAAHPFQHRGISADRL